MEGSFVIVGPPILCQNASMHAVDPNIWYRWYQSNLMQCRLPNFPPIDTHPPNAVRDLIQAGSATWKRWRMMVGSWLHMIVIENNHHNPHHRLYYCWLFYSWPRFFLIPRFLHQNPGFASMIWQKPGFRTKPWKIPGSRCAGYIYIYILHAYFYCIIEIMGKYKG